MTMYSVLFTNHFAKSDVYAEILRILVFHLKVRVNNILRHFLNGKNCTKHMLNK